MQKSQSSKLWIFSGLLILLAGVLLLDSVSPRWPSLPAEKNAESDPAYCPDLPVTRGEGAAFVAQAWGLGFYQAATPSFEDVPKSHWAYGYIEALTRAEITDHCGDRHASFCPNSPMTRAEAIAWLVRAQGARYLPGSGTRFQDVPEDHWAYSYIQKGFQDDIIAPCGLSQSPISFCPNANLTRAELAVWLARARGWLADYKSSPTFGDVSREHAAYGYIERLNEEGLRVRCLFPAGPSVSTFLGIDWLLYYHRYRVAFVAAGLVMGVAVVGLTALSLEAGVLLLASVLPFQQRGVNLGFFSLSLVDLVLWPLLAFWIIRLLKQDARGLRQSYDRLPLTILPLLGAGALFILSFSKAASVSLAFKEYIRYYVAVAAYLFVYLYFSKNATQRRVINTFLIVLLSSGIASVLVLLWQYSYSGMYTFREIARLDVYPFRQSSVFTDPNYYAEFLMTLLPVSIGFCVTAKGRVRVLFLATTFLFALGLLLAFSRAGFAAMVVAIIPLVIYLAASYPPTVRTVFAGGVGVSAASLLALQWDAVRGRVLLLFQLWANRLAFIAEAATDATATCNPIICRSAESVRLVGGQLVIDSGAQRLNILRSTMNMIVDNPWVGVGLGNFERQFAAYGIGDTGGTYRAAHNTFLRLMAETGVFAFVVYAAFLALTLGYLLKALRSCRDAAWKPILAGLLAGWIGSLVASLFLDQFFEVYYWIYLGIAMAAAYQANNGKISGSSSCTARRGSS